MQDAIYILIMLAFFALAGVFVRACERIIGSDDAYESPDTEPAPEREAAA